MNLGPFPEEIQSKICDIEYVVNDIGMSGSTVLQFPDMVLKIEKASEISNHEITMLHWLQGKLPVPSIISFVQENDINYLLMSRVKGDMMCSSDLLAKPETLIPIIAEGFKMLWNIDTHDCPINNSTHNMLRNARKRVENNEITFEESVKN